MAPNSELRCGMQCAGLSHMGVCECVYMQWTDEGFAQAWSKLMAQNANKIALHTPIPKSYLRSNHVDAKKKEKQGQGLWILDKRKRKITTALSLCLGKGKKKYPQPSLSRGTSPGDDVKSSPGEGIDVWWSLTVFSSTVSVSLIWLHCLNLASSEVSFFSTIHSVKTVTLFDPVFWLSPQSSTLTKRSKTGF